MLASNICLDALPVPMLNQILHLDGTSTQTPEMPANLCAGHAPRGSGAVWNKADLDGTSPQRCLQTYAQGTLLESQAQYGTKQTSTGPPCTVWNTSTGPPPRVACKPMRRAHS